MKPILQIQMLTKNFGGLLALSNVTFEVQKGSIHGLIGPNGAGKSTLFKNIAGFYTPSQGDILFNGESIKGYTPSHIASLGIVRTFQETTLFQEMTVFENALIGTHKTSEPNIFSALFGLDKQQQAKARKKTDEVLEFMGLTDRKDQLASELPLGSQRALSIAIALASEPTLMLMDEPFAGMNPEETRHMMTLTERVRDAGITVVLVEHDMKAVMGLCNYLCVLNFGTVLAEGTPESIRNDPKVISAYLGGG